MATIEQLFQFAAPYTVRNHADSEHILAEGWDAGRPLEILVRPGRAPELLDGNRRVRWLGQNGGGAINVPIIFKLGPGKTPKT